MSKSQYFNTFLSYTNLR